MRGQDDHKSPKTGVVMPPATWIEWAIMGAGMAVLLVAVNALWWGSIVLGLALMGTALLLYRRRVGALWRWTDQTPGQDD